MKYSVNAKLILGLIVLIGLTTLGWSWLAWHNLTWLRDPHNVVASAQLVATNDAQSMHQLPWGGFVANTNIEGSIKATCTNGVRAEGGYITRNFGSTYTVTRDCQIEQVR